MTRNLHENHMELKCSHFGDESFSVINCTDNDKQTHNNKNRTKQIQKVVQIKEKPKPPAMGNLLKSMQ